MRDRRGGRQIRATLIERRYRLSRMTEGVEVRRKKVEGRRTEGADGAKWNFGPADGSGKGRSQVQLGNEVLRTAVKSRFLRASRARATK